MSQSLFVFSRRGVLPPKRPSPPRRPPTASPAAGQRSISTHRYWCPVTEDWRLPPHVTNVTESAQVLLRKRSSHARTRKVAERLGSRER